MFSWIWNLKALSTERELKLTMYMESRVKPIRDSHAPSLDTISLEL